MIFVFNAALTAVATIVNTLMVGEPKSTGDNSDCRSTDSEKIVINGSPSAYFGETMPHTSRPCDIEKGAMIDTHVECDMTAA